MGRQHHRNGFVADPAKVAGNGWGNLIAFKGGQYSELAADRSASFAKRIFPRLSID